MSFSSKSSIARSSNHRICYIRSSSSSSAAASGSDRSWPAGADLDLVAVDRNDRLDHARHGRLELVVHLLGLDLDDQLAGGDPVALTLEPTRDGRVFHLRSDGGKGELDHC
jgi:hypothetical protein